MVSGEASKTQESGQYLPWLSVFGFSFSVGGIQVQHSKAGISCRLKCGQIINERQYPG